ncbi:MAG TPA: baseplate J/gp47 family protein [Longimicrobium sp.]|nr:baseplate J/gp47 family protein [Longimicrobium sp.]
MSYVAEPYAQFVDDLLRSMTGGVSRERFVFVAGEGPFRLNPPGPVLPSTLSVFGQAAGAFAVFRRDRDWALGPESTVLWLARADGTPAADAVWPDEGTPFYVNYDPATHPDSAAPLLTDRNPGSVTRVLAESLAREYAVVSRQLESVYRAGFLETAEGRDLDALAALVGIERRSRTYAVGTVVFSRATPAPADVFVPAGTRLSTAEPPAVVFETTEDRTLRRGELSVEAPVQATIRGGTGVVPARAITVIHRPVLGIEAVHNPQSAELRGADESDEALRARVRRALEGSGRATRGALLAALTTLPGVREKDVRIAEEPLARPGVITVSVAAELDADDAERAVALIEEARPVGIRVLHDLDAPATVLSASLPPNVVDDASEPDAGEGDPEGLYLPVKVRVLVLPASASLTPADRTALQGMARDTARAFVAEAGIGETLVYNRLIAALMALEGVLDVAVELYPRPAAAGDPTGPRRRNLVPGAALRPRLDDADLSVEVAGEVVAFDVDVAVQLSPLALATGDVSATLESARLEIAGRLQDGISTLSTVNAAGLMGRVPATENYSLITLVYTVEYLEAGLRVLAASPPVPLTALERPWVRTVRISLPV